MTPERRDELARLTVAIVAPLSKAEAKETVAGMFGVTEDTACALIVRADFGAREGRDGSMSKQCSLYVIATMIDGEMSAPIKVGIAKNVKKRLSDFQTASAYELAVAYDMHFPTRQFAEEMERATHALSKVVGVHRRGEWIDLSPSDGMILIACAMDAATNKGAGDYRLFAKYLSDQAKVFIHLRPRAATVIPMPTKAI